MVLTGKQPFIFLIEKRKIIFFSILFFSLVILTFFIMRHNASLKVASIKGRVIVVDPGHGGEDPGACSNRGIYEKDITLAVGLLVAKKLEATGATVILTRDQDIDYVLPRHLRGGKTKKRSDLDRRLEMAEKYRADLYVSVHVNAIRPKNVSGAEAFYNHNSPEGKMLAESIQRELRKIPLMNKKVAKVGRYYILEKAKMPAVIVEMGFLSNPGEKRRLLDPAYQNKLATAISKGIVNYFSSLPEEKARVTLVIDDFGSVRAGGCEEMMSIKRPLTFAVMPNLPESRRMAIQAKEKGYQVILHLPMQANWGKASWLGPGAIKKGMSQEEIKATVLADLESVPGAVGINNHMGSRVVGDRKAMQAVVEVAKEKGLFILDSVTDKHTVFTEVAKNMGVPCVKRDVFLDEINKVSKIKKQLFLLAEVALRQGKAVGIGHVGLTGRNTARAIKEMIPELEKRGIKFVYLSELVE